MRASDLSTLGAKARLVLRIWLCFARVLVELRRRALPEVVARLGAPVVPPVQRQPVDRLRHAVERALVLGRLRPRCLTSALVLFRLLRAQGDHAQLVIGLPTEPQTHAAHAWVELHGVDVGPGLGRARHEPLGRFGGHR